MVFYTDDGNFCVIYWIVRNFKQSAWIFSLGNKPWIITFININLHRRPSVHLSNGYHNKMNINIHFTLNLKSWPRSYFRCDLTLSKRNFIYTNWNYYPTLILSATSLVKSKYIPDSENGKTRQRFRHEHIRLLDELHVYRYKYYCYRSLTEKYKCIYCNGNGAQLY